ncbi:pyridoxal 5'-phosphate synthase glutaminase subunit PdxT [Tessaracoccus flavus]|uniref:Pyridoxal 5'-phosphate synthase subunit PdxT n=1 Tax=Tessaracoccus flavus TaxID=1610493 RepID=A0A1Q2CBX2_9ACTN|nr:pyridoxal 5'-phosphate synthase glutaminase subunit PdxT [Tessaracoccus flavus]AQP43608.1 glutamine amidotransferase subunit PdxT [Tessaracoccus flavus]SDY88551.1 pyridoxal phosphate synthase yaaE subunit [Tessaracoccus flavus]
MVTVGVVALQGAVREHARAVQEVGGRARFVRTPGDLAGLDGLILPGGESTVMARLARGTGLFPAIRAALDRGLPVLGTCAGLILLADDVADPGALEGLETVGGLDVRVRRNAYGSQLASGVVPVTAANRTTFSGVFIRAPRIESVGPGVVVLATRAGEPVAVRQGSVTACAFHPELAEDRRFHEWLLSSTAPV